MAATGWSGCPGSSECVEEWKLTLGAPFEPAHVSYVAGAELPTGTPAVLKLNFPELDSEHEADALAHWQGAGAVLLLALDPRPARTIRRRLDQLASELELDRERMRGWGIAHALAWDPDEGMIACARWLAAA